MREKECEFSGEFASLMIEKLLLPNFINSRLALVTVSELRRTDDRFAVEVISSS